MSRAASLGEKDAAQLLAIDSAGGAAIAAAQAIRRGARLLLGPVPSADVRPVLAATGGRVPVIAFSNDGELADSGAFLLGLSAWQVTSALLRYARGRGVRTLTLAPGDDGWGRQVAAAAERLRAELGLTFAPQGDAFLATTPGTAPPAATQLLLATPVPPDQPERLAGAWTAAVDPEPFGRFVEDYRAANGGDPGLLAALAHDAARVAATVRAAGTIDRAGLLSPAGFTGATGPFRFRSDGTALRDLTILAAGGDGWETVGRSPGG